MPRSVRPISRTGYYHVTCRGNGRQLLFEDDDDRRFYLRTLARCCAEENVSVLAWCVMDNHVHLLLYSEDGGLAAAMARINTRYAHHYSDRTGHVGHVFQGRYHSSPVETESHLLESVRYIHNNPEQAGICPAAEYKWSSYAEYTGSPGICDTSIILAMLGGVKGFKEFCSKHPEELADENDEIRGAVDHTTLAVASEVLGDQDPRALSTLPIEERNAAIGKLREAGMSVRKIERLTGIGRGIIQRVRV
ncbi:MAG: transposase [Atopobiaceae bacterium]|nr:transposase [Atopobiaceae bacterium]